MSMLFDNVVPWLENTDFRLNIAAEALGVFFSIPLSIWIASLLDRRLERRRKKSALMAVVRMSQHELHYFSTKYLRDITDETGGAEQAIVFYRRTKQAAANAELAIRDIISNAQAQLGGDISTDLLRVMFRLRYQWRTFTEFIVFEDAYFVEKGDNGRDPTDNVETRLNGIINVIGWIHERNTEIAATVSKKYGRDTKNDAPKPDIDALRKLLTKIYTHRSHQIKSASNLYSNNPAENT